MKIDMELLRQLYKVCQYIFNSKDEFMSRFLDRYQVLDGAWCELENVSFSGKKCHVVLKNLDSNKLVFEQIDVMDVLDWMEE